jgi:hypothetical protein
MWNIVLFVICIFPGTLDWLLHAIGVWRGNNLVRVSTGFLLGVPIGILFTSLLHLKYWIFLSFFGAFLAYLLVLLFICGKSGKVRAYLDELVELASCSI